MIVKPELRALIERHDALKADAYAAAEKPGGKVALIRIEVAEYYKQLPGLLAEAIAIAEGYKSAPQIVLDEGDLQSAVQRALAGLMEDGGHASPKAKKSGTVYPPPPPGALPISAMIRRHDGKSTDYQRVLFAGKKGRIQIYGKPKNYRITEADYLAWKEANDD